MKDNQALIIVDVQKDFLETGALPVKDGSQVVPVINRISPKFKHVVFTQDWHPQGHISFASSHPGQAPYSTSDVSYGKQVLWPEHCVQNTSGAEFADGLNTEKGDCFVRKGAHPDIDSYSAFNEDFLLIDLRGINPCDSSFFPGGSSALERAVHVNSAGSVFNDGYPQAFISRIQGGPANAKVSCKTTDKDICNSLRPQTNT